MKKLILSLAVGLSTFAIAACDGGGGGGGGGGIIATCVAPNTLNQYGQCVTPGGNVVDSTARYGISNCSLSSNPTCNNVTEFTVTNVGVYRDFLEKALGACTLQYSSGYYDCKNWWPGQFEISMAGQTNLVANQYCSPKGLTVPSSMQVYVRAGYVASGYFNYGATLGLGWPYNNGGSFNGTVNVINDCKGFDVRMTLNRYPFQIIVREGNLNTNSVNFELAWGSPDTPNQAATVFARGVMYRY